MIFEKSFLSRGFTEQSDFTSAFYKIETSTELIARLYSMNETKCTFD